MRYRVTLRYRDGSCDDFAAFGRKTFESYGEAEMSILKLEKFTSGDAWVVTEVPDADDGA